jgi:O-antigen/teichoic acid export membrane protein
VREAAAFLVVMLSVQSFVPLAQLGAAAFLPPETFGALRTAESIFGTVLLAGALGMPTLAVTLSGSVTPADRTGLLKRLAGLALLASSIGALITLVMAPYAVAQVEAATLLRGLAPVLVVAALGRTALGFAQGLGRFPAVGPWVLGVTALALPTVLGLVSALGGRGWVAGRLIAEVAFLAAVLVGLRDLLRNDTSSPVAPSLRATRLAQGGAIVSASLFLRGALDAVALAALGYAVAEQRDVGFFGLGTLLVGALVIPAAAFFGSMLPRLAATRDDLAAARGLLRHMGRIGAGLTGAGALVVALLMPHVTGVLGAGYRGAAATVVVLLLAAPLRTLTMAGGQMLLAHHRLAPSLILNGASVCLLGIVVYVAARTKGSPGAAWGMVAVEAVTAAAFWVVAHRALRGDAARHLGGGVPSP